MTFFAKLKLKVIKNCRKKELFLRKKFKIKGNKLCFIFI